MAKRSKPNPAKSIGQEVARQLITRMQCGENHYGITLAGVRFCVTNLISVRAARKSLRDAIDTTIARRSKHGRKKRKAVKRGK